MGEAIFGEVRGDEESCKDIREEGIREAYFELPMDLQRYTMMARDELEMI